MFSFTYSWQQLDKSDKYIQLKYCSLITLLYYIRKSAAIRDKEKEKYMYSIFNEKRNLQIIHCICNFNIVLRNFCQNFKANIQIDEKYECTRNKHRIVLKCYTGGYRKTIRKIAKNTYPEKKLFTIYKLEYELQH